MIQQILLEAYRRCRDQGFLSFKIQLGKEVVPDFSWEVFQWCIIADLPWLVVFWFQGWHRLSDILG